MADNGYRVIYELLPEGGYQATLPALLGIITYGRTLDEAHEMARHAIGWHTKGLLKDGEQLPAPTT